MIGRVLNHCINQHAITHVTLSPSVLATLSPNHLATLQVVVVAGEPCGSDLMQQWCQHFHFINAYGPTEATVCATMAHLLKTAHTCSIGKPIANVTVYVLDNHLNPVPIGVMGELYIGGVGVATGYLNQPDLTAEKFIPNPFSFSGGKLYKTGDLVRWLPDGNLAYVGRVDHQIKVRGFRIEPEAIEAHLLQYPGITQCVVASKKDIQNSSNSLVAYLALPKQVSFHLADLKRFLKQYLPDYAIPSLFMAVDTFALTTNGKIDRRKLPEIDATHRLLDATYVAPTSSLEKSLQALWSEILGINSIGIQDDFFNLGGHSLLLTHLMFKLSAQFNYHLSLSKFTPSPTIATLAKLMTQTPNAHFSNSEMQWRFDSVLDLSIQPLSCLHAPKPPAAILLTGATGFLGVHLLHDLCQYTQAHLYCLIRCENTASGKMKLKAVLQTYQLSKVDWTRIHIIKGDLAATQLGIGDDQWQWLAEKIDAIYHNGAYVHHLYSYEMLRSANVSSTIELLKLATLTRNKVLHYVSSLSAVGGYLNALGELREDFLEDSTAFDPPSNGYNQTKWVSEQLLAQAHRRGIQVNLYRPGWIMGHSQSGRIPAPQNHLLLLLKGCIQLGYAPLFSGQLDMLPVNFVSGCIVQLAQASPSTGSVFNLSHPDPIAWTDFMHFIQESRYRVKLVAQVSWCQHLTNLSPENALYGLASIYLNASDDARADTICQMHRVAHSNTLACLQQRHLSFPKINTHLLKRYLRFLEHTGFLQKTVVGCRPVRFNSM